ncbi:DUF58 domain-containing protein [Exiguobacterium sp. SRB7LM]|uniref:DUF58 domain-containing protein n=1 Tax=Exiguobacterium sp. SRB7LM TaxID=2608401 RepID=UPI001E2A53C6|nr:DUF58 domain-containing protein [Exiguobacterium sp. SRB7LM]
MGGSCQTIDWVATSKVGCVQVKVYERQNLDTFTVSLDLSGPLGNGLHAQYEDLIQQTAYWVSYLIKKDCNVELLINRLDQHSQIDHIVLGEGRKQLRDVVEVIRVMKGETHAKNDGLTHMLCRTACKHEDRISRDD